MILEILSGFKFMQMAVFNQLWFYSYYVLLVTPPDLDQGRNCCGNANSGDTASKHHSSDDESAAILPRPAADSSNKDRKADAARQSI